MIGFAVRTGLQALRATATNRNVQLMAMRGLAADAAGGKSGGVSGCHDPSCCQQLQAVAVTQAARMSRTTVNVFMSTLSWQAGRWLDGMVIPLCCVTHLICLPSVLLSLLPPMCASQSTCCGATVCLQLFLVSHMWCFPLIWWLCWFLHLLLLLFFRLNLHG